MSLVSLEEVVLASFTGDGHGSVIGEVVCDTTENSDWLSLESLVSFLPGVESFPRVSNAILELVVASSASVLVLNINTSPEGSVVDGAVWVASGLEAELLEVLGVMFNVCTNGIVTLVVNAGLRGQLPFLLVVVFNFNLFSETR